MSDLRTSIEGGKPARKRWPWIAAAGAAAVVVVAGSITAATLAGAAGDPESSPAADDGTPVAGGTLQFASIDGQLSADPHAAYNYTDSIVADNVTDKLTWQDPETGEITPWLAESWEVNDDLTEFTFHLRDDVTFSDGTPFDAAVVQANFDQYYSGDTDLGIKPNGARLLAGYLGTDVPDEYTAVVRFEKPTASFLQGSSFTGGAQPAIVALSTLALSAEERTDATKIIGTGPFVYEEWTAQVRTVLVKRDGYDWAPEAIGHDGEAYLDEIVFNVIPEASVRTGSLKSGEIDATLDVGTTDEGPLTDAGFEILAGPVSGVDIRFDFNTQLFPTDDLAVRKAIQLGWSRESVETTVLTDSYSISTSVLAATVPGYEDHSDRALQYDPDEASRLLDEAGWEVGDDGIRTRDGQRLEVRLNGNDNLVVNKPAYESIQQDLAAIGIDLQLTVVPTADFAANSSKFATDWNINASNSSRNDPVQLKLTYSTDFGNSANLADDAEGAADLTAVLAQLETTLDPDIRAGYAAEAQDLILEDLALTNPVYTPSQVIAQAPYVHGIIFDAQSRNHFVDTWKSAK